MVSTEKGVASSAISLLSGREELICNVHVSFAFGVTVKPWLLSTSVVVRPKKARRLLRGSSHPRCGAHHASGYTIGNEEEMQLRTLRQYSK